MDFSKDGKWTKVYIACMLGSGIIGFPLLLLFAVLK